MMHLAKFTARAVLLFSTLFVIAGCSSDYERYENKEDGYSLELPSGWDISEGNRNTSVLAVNETEDADTLFTETLSVIVEPGKNILVEDYLDTLMLDAMGLIGFQEHERATLDSAGVTIPYVLFSHRAVQNTHVAVMVGAVVENGTGYVITASARPDRFNIYRDALRHSIGSFRVDSKGSSSDNSAENSADNSSENSSDDSAGSATIE